MNIWARLRQYGTLSCSCNGISGCPRTLENVLTEKRNIPLANTPGTTVNNYLITMRLRLSEVEKVTFSNATALPLTK